MELDRLGFVLGGLSLVFVIGLVGIVTGLLAVGYRHRWLQTLNTVLTAAVLIIGLMFVRPNTLAGALVIFGAAIAPALAAIFAGPPRS